MTFAEAVRVVQPAEGTLDYRPARAVPVLYTGDGHDDGHKTTQDIH
ncbi:hypothetical protein Metal_1250 [Methylomicrobium album BG8]|uniref:Uncharacterized protein n=1 Tax=Methylomicrobium album BG8 TaxID=686340 RepID=H8GIM5_METAL|nr:hypothetical protein Metal_1250 [Methylomicrobium album BG8]